jgi:hypothetical protein
MLSSWLLQHYGVVVGSLSEDGMPFYYFGDIHCVFINSRPNKARQPTAGSVLNTVESLWLRVENVATRHPTSCG